MRVICENCNGEGFIPAGITAITCDQCNGEGYLPLDYSVLRNLRYTFLHCNPNVVEQIKKILNNEQNFKFQG